MKRFIYKTCGILSVCIVTISSLIFYYEITNNLPFITNSVSFNAKAKFIANHAADIERSKIIVIGSSMSLNNIDCNQLSNQLEVPIINVASWNMKFSDFNDFKIWEPTHIIYLNIHFSDLHPSDIQKKPGYPYPANFLTNLKTIITDFKTYYSQNQQYKKYTLPGNNTEYNSLNFDESGSVIFSSRETFVVTPERWNKNVPVFSREEINSFVGDIKTKSSLVDKVIISFSPGRPSLVTPEKIQAVELLANELKSLDKVIFLNNYNRPEFTDEYFVDKSHFNRQGASKYTCMISDQLKPLIN